MIHIIKIPRANFPIKRYEIEKFITRSLEGRLDIYKQTKCRRHKRRAPVHGGVRCRETPSQMSAESTDSTIHVDFPATYSKKDERNRG